MLLSWVKHLIAEKKIYYIEDDVNEARRESKIIRYTVGKTIDRYDFEKKAFVPDDEMLRMKPMHQSKSLQKDFILK